MANRDLYISKRYAYGLDLGSNTLRGTLLECKSGKFLLSHESIVRTADGINENALIKETTKERVISAVEKGKQLISKFGNQNIAVRAVSTEAVRLAKNGASFLKDIESITGIRFEIIDGYEEAKLTMEAIRHRLSIIGLDNQNIIAIDIGGGSTEIGIYSNSSFDAKSFKIGILTLSQKYKSIDKLKDALDYELQNLREFVLSIDKKIKKSAVFVVTAGTPTTVEALKQGMDYDNYNPAKINGNILSMSDIDKVYDRLQLMTPNEVSKAVGAGREDLIPVGIEILKSIYKILDRDSAIVIDDGLREGVAISLCGK